MNIREICQTYNYTQTELSLKFDIPFRSIQNWYNDVRKPPDYVVRMIITILEYEKTK